jgi:hypothetical protein
MLADCTMTMMQLRRRLPLMALIVSLLHHSYSFSIVSSIHATKRQTLVTCFHAANDNLDDNINLKEELTKYLDIRRQLRADDEAKAEVGKVVGGTRGNPVLEYISGAPNKEIVIEDEPNIFDYDQLTKYGFDYLVTPIMNAGGRLEMYKLMDMESPVIKVKKKKKAPPLKIDRTGESDPARYTGLKMGQVLDDDAMGKALEEFNRKKREGLELRPKLEEEKFVKPFADNRNVGPRLTPDWTPEMLDEEGKKRGRAQAWARKARAGEFVKDPYEMLAIEGAIQAYSIFFFLLISFAFGRATPSLFEMMHLENVGHNVQEIAQVPALVAILTAVGSSVVTSTILAPEKNRSQFVWAVKGLFGGPVAIAELRGLDMLQTRGEVEAENAK